MYTPEPLTSSIASPGCGSGGAVELCGKVLSQISNVELSGGGGLLTKQFELVISNRIKL